MKTQINNIAVVGGGTAGLIAALILKNRFSDIKVSVIRSSKIGIVGVGEGSTEHWSELMKFLNIDFKELIRECDATCKIGIMFENWTDKPYLHSVIGDYVFRVSQYNAMYGKIISEKKDAKDLVSSVYWDSKIELEFLQDRNTPVSAQYHFNTNKLNAFLTEKAKNIGIDFFDDEILDVKLDEQGNIKELSGEKSNYQNDFYIDSTGFSRMLMIKLGAKWRSYSKFLKSKAAIAFPTGDTDNYNMWTLARAMDYGWMFRLPVWGRHGNGYIFDSDFIDFDQAKKEVEDFLGHEIDVAKKFNFDPGTLDRVWIKNCVAVGLSASFVEPMEASSIGTTIQQCFLLMHKIPNYDQTVIDDYNTKMNQILDNIRDFVALHYITKKNNTEYWKYISTIDLPDSLQENLEIWKHKLPVGDDFSNISRYILFKENHFSVVMHGLGLFDYDNIAYEYHALSEDIKDRANRAFEFLKAEEKDSPKIIHKEYLRSIRNS